MSWYFREGNEEIGPISKAQLQELIISGRINGQTMVRNITMTEWRSLSEMVHPNSEPAGPLPPDAPGSTAHDTYSPPQTTSTPVKVLDRSEVPFQFKGSGGEYFRIWMVNILLSLVTAGVYSAWAKVRRKRYFYGNTSLYDSAFQYLADPVKILKGRAVVFLGFLGYALINHFIPSAAILVMVAFILVLPWLVVRSLAFNARNSAWRNIRFNFMGTYSGAAKVFILWPMLVPLTFGILSPYVFYRQKKFIVENSAFGTTPFTFQATARDYYAVVLRFLLPVFLIAMVVVGILLVSGKYLMTYLAMAPLAGGVVFAVVYFYGFAYFSVKFSNLLYNSSAIVNHAFKATMQVPQYAWIIFSNTLATVLTIGLFHPFAQVRALAYKIQHLAFVPGGDPDQFVAAELKETSALGDELSDFMDFDFGL